MPSTYPAAPDDLTPGNTTLDHGDVTDALAAVQATLGVNPQGAAADVAARLAAPLGPSVDIVDQGFDDPEPPAAGYTRLTATTNEGEDSPPYLTIRNSEGFNGRVLTGVDASEIFLDHGFLGAYDVGTIVVRGQDPNFPGLLSPGTDGQVLTADSTAEMGLTYTDPHIVTSPLGVQYRIVVDEAGVLGTEAV